MTGTAAAASAGARARRPGADGRDLYIASVFEIGQEVLELLDPGKGTIALVPAARTLSTRPASSGSVRSTAGHHVVVVGSTPWARSRPSPGIASAVDDMVGGLLPRCRDELRPGEPWLKRKP